MNLIKNKFLILIFLGILIFSLIFVLKIYIFFNLFPVQKNAQEEFLSFAPKFYPMLTWVQTPENNQKFEHGLYYFSSKISGDISIYGREWVARREKISGNETSALETNVRNYYISDLDKLGWKFDTKINGFLLQPLQANGPGGYILGFIKVKNNTAWVILLQVFKSTLTKGPPFSFADCPCNIEYKIFLSSPMSLEKMFSSSN